MTSKKQRLLSISDDWTASEISISYRRGIKMNTPINSVETARFFIRYIWDRELINLQEQFMTFYFNRSFELLGYRLISTGDMHSVPVNVKLIVSLALHSMAHTVIVAHNHPSGNTEPSNSDKALTLKIKRALSLIDVKLVDHLIITETDVLSFACNNWL